MVIFRLGFKEDVFYLLNKRHKINIVFNGTIALTQDTVWFQVDIQEKNLIFTIRGLARIIAFLVGTTIYIITIGY